MTPAPALVHGAKAPPLWFKTLGALIDEQANRYEDHTAAVFSWQNVRLSYRQLSDRSKVLGKAMLEMGLRNGDCIGIMAGNCYQYIEVFLAGGRIGCPVVVLNNTYTAEELRNAVQKSSCKLVFLASEIGSRNLSGHINILRGSSRKNPALPDLRRVVCLGGSQVGEAGVEMQTYNTFTSNGHSVFMNDSVLKRAESLVRPDDVLNLQFTSGTTGSPKAAMLTHTNLINNARFVGDAMALTHEDVLCCPPPLFHCFGLVLGFLDTYTHGSTIVFPSDFFDVGKVVDALVEEDVTVLLGVPTMYISELEVMEKTGQRPRRLRTGLASGSTVSQSLMDQLREKMGVEKMLIAYGMTETSPVTFITSLSDPESKATRTVGRVIPHTSAKVIDSNGKLLGRGERGELCTSGFALQKGYWKNKEKTKESMKEDENGVLWMHTGDEAILDDDGYAHITGRIKDIIIRGGENIFPEKLKKGSCNILLSARPALWLSRTRDTARNEELNKWVGQLLGRHKAPAYCFWLGDAGIGNDFPKTGSGKIKKHVLCDIGNNLVHNGPVKAKL
ncbi:acetyl-CoA synthetase-like protein [Penicillium cosmopolitanum]|uniref:Acetyl-CoA synthetase-like protein n=1 Tax=Penicillium cosmopolitanum TaxID=1131564 RepID=A0A9W9VMR7_9EURO|nr:acetyl-CoA synthetase-like protein [Penicillium cosmopolitanum]KAJ5385960.1 acetyl-CoA synthetase-like protein [Penicillium cosmopolitanum]